MDPVEQLRAILADIDVITDPDAKPPISFYAGHYPEPF